jgi:hypothetical protein
MSEKFSLGAYRGESKEGWGKKCCQDTSFKPTKIKPLHEPFGSSMVINSNLVKIFSLSKVAILYS